MKTAIYGGAFNPVHNEHINIVRAAVEGLGLDRVVIVPTFLSPHKRGALPVKGRERLEMCRRAFASVPQAEISDCEIKRGGISYSYVTCRRFRKLYPDDELFFIIGADMLAGFEFWKEPEEILKCVTLAVCAREDGEELNSLIKNFHAKFKREIVKIGYVGKAVSSTRIRALAALGEDFSHYVPENVRKFIKDNCLYEIPSLRGVKKYLTESRWKHTVGVAVCAAENSRGAGVCEEDAIIAAALHDCAKYLSLSAPELEGFVPPDGVPDTVIHQYSGAYVAEKVFGVNDGGILSAIRYHASGRENMSALEKLIYLSDLLEENRNFEGVESLRRAFKRGLDEGLLKALEHQLKYLKNTGMPVYPLTERAYRYAKENYDK